MPRYAAFLRGISQMNTRMPELKRAFEVAGFTDVATGLSSGNVERAPVRTLALVKDITTRTWDTVAKVTRK